MKLLSSLSLAVVTLGTVASGCTAPNKAKCCLTPEDCSAIGVSEPRGCDPGLACVDTNCVVPSCSTDGCAATAPVCDTATDVCTGCADAADCARFPDQDVCDLTAGACVECVSPSDCTAAEPVCDSSTCRECKLDSECPSGACGDDGGCVLETNVVYLDPAGVDTGSCTRAAPCGGMSFGLSRLTAARNHLVLASGTYAVPNQVRVATQTTAAAYVFVHGHGATLDGSDAEVLITLSLPSTLRDLELAYPNGTGIDVGQTSKLERLKIRANRCLQITGTVQGVDLEFDCLNNAITTGGTLSLDRAVIRNGITGIVATGVVNISNVLVHGTSSIAIDVSASGAQGSIEFVTIADTGNGSTSASGIACHPSLAGGIAVRSSIVWTPASLRPPIVGLCALSSTIAGPMAIAGATSTDPKFVAPTAQDYHLLPGSPARDMVDTGPAFDFERDARPRGTRFDVGADEGQ